MYHPTGSFAEAPEQPRISEDQPIFAMSYYFDRAVDVGQSCVCLFFVSLYVSLFLSLSLYVCASVSVFVALEEG